MNIKDLRTKAGLKQTEVCKAVGVSLTAYQLWEYGVNSPNPENEEKLKKVLNYEEEYE